VTKLFGSFWRVYDRNKLLFGGPPHCPFMPTSRSGEKDENKMPLLTKRRTKVRGQLLGCGLIAKRYRLGKSARYKLIFHHQIEISPIGKFSIDVQPINEGSMAFIQQVPVAPGNGGICVWPLPKHRLTAIRFLFFGGIDS
jgi:hypothetical protein